MAWQRLAAVAIGGALFTGCVGPKFVSDVSTREGKAKFLYQQQRFLDTKQGLIECDAAPDGTLSRCAEKRIVYEK